jgi:hypothetical protein
MIYTSPGNPKQVTIYADDPSTVASGTTTGIVNLPIGIIELSVTYGTATAPSIFTADFTPVLAPEDGHARATFSAATVTGTVTI